MKNMGKLMRTWLFTLIFACLFVPALLLAQTEDQAEILLDQQQAYWDELIEQATDLTVDDSDDLDQIDVLRSNLSEAQSDIRIQITTAGSDLSRLEAQLESLAPASDEGNEQEELRNRRDELTAAIGKLQVAQLDLNEYLEKVTDAVGHADTVAREVLAGRLIEVLPSPLNPENWAHTAKRLAEEIDAWISSIRTKLASPDLTASFYTKFLLGTAAAIIGAALLMGIKFRFGTIVELAYRRSGQTRPTVWVWLLVNAFWLGLVAIAATLFVVGLNLTGLIDGANEEKLKGLGLAFGCVAIFYWISLNIFFPEVSAFRLLGFQEPEAKKGRRYFRLLGVATAILVYSGVLNQQGFVSPTILSIVVFLAVLPIGLLFLQLIRLFQALNISGETEATESEVAGPRRGDQMGPSVAKWFKRFVKLVAFAAPVLALIGYSNAAAFLAEGTAFSIALLAASYIVFRLVLALIDYTRSLNVPRDQPKRDAGLISVGVGFVVTMAAVPFVALIWGAQQSDLQSAWFRMRDGVAFGDTRVSLTDIVLFFVVFGIGYLLTRSLQAFVQGTVLPRTQLDIGGRNALLSGIRYIGLFLAALFAFSSTGLDLSNLALVAGALSVGIGFGLQTIVSNFVSGIILLIERPIKQGDWIEVAGFAGYVRDIKVRSTEIETFDRASVIVPNQELIAGTVLNWTHSSMSGRAIVPVGVAYGTDPRRVEKILLEIARDHPLVLLKPAPSVIFSSFGDSSLNFEIRCFLRDVNYKLSAISDMNFEIAKRFEEENIEIPFVQRDVNLRNISEIAKLVGRPGSDEET